ncbi:thiol:disulfide interchange protein [Erythrobacter jejuensis]|uniref:Thiol:disulfide interchange protein n=2 Tax=Parerythrobacter jejuensis TaxID=795812 RepID=A0A845AVX0_9SPHN|nr:thiol:disulfide interchange protein [Parerythrobacter jejuensis]
MLSARWTFRRLMAGLALALAAMMATGVHAQNNNIRATLVAEGPVAPGEKSTLALRFSPIKPEWHGYWSNPGDAGLGMVLEWDLPDGVTVGEPQYPTPTRLLIDGLMNHVFEGDYAVLVPLTLAEDFAGSGLLEVSVEAFYLACTDEICVPEEASLSVTVPIGASGASNPAFAQYRSAIAPRLDSAARFQQTASLLRIAIPLPASIDVGEPHVFVGNRDLVNYADAQGFAREGDVLIAEIPLARTGEMPELVEGILRLGNGDGLRFEARAGDVPSGGTRLMMRGSELPALWILLGGALLGGLILNVMPCVFPILSLKALSLAKAGGGEREARLEGLAYTTGVILACIALGGVMLGLRAAGEQVGWAFQLQEPGVVVALLVLASLITANLLGAFELPGLSISQGSTPSGAFTTGLLAAFVATPCTGPFMAAALGAALLLPAPVALLLFAALGLGLALPFLLLGFVPALRRILPKPGQWMETFKKVLAVPMGLTALALIWLVWRIGGMSFAVGAVALTAASIAIVALLLGARMRVERARKAVIAVFSLVAIMTVVAMTRNFAPPVADTSSATLVTEPFSAEALQRARGSGVPVFVYFTADWCLTCKVNERVAIERDATQAAFEDAGVVALRGDWTLRQPEITQFLNGQGAAGVPLYLWYAPGASEPNQLSQVLGPDSLVTLAQQSQALQSRALQSRPVQSQSLPPRDLAAAR